MGVVYKKICSETGLIYYGKFEGTWDERFRSGWSGCSCEYFVNPTVVFIEIDIPNDKLKEREDYYIQNFECVNLQGKYSHLTNAEYAKQYRIDNKDIIKQYHIDNKDKVQKYHKQYYADNIESISKKSKQYRIDNKETINKKIKCDNCGSTTTKRHLKRHQTSKKCMTYLNKY